jgi:hypothetical protein
MTVEQLALGIFLGVAGVEIFKVILAMIYESYKRNAAMREMHELTDDFIDRMHKDIMADREAQAKKTVKKAPVRKPVVKKAPITPTRKRG